MNIMPSNRDAETTPRSKKLAEGVAAAIARDIMEMGWPVGRTVGSMQELLARHGVSHAVLREAVRQIEQNGLAVMRRGAGGGLVVARQPGDVAAQTTATYLQLIDVDVRELIDARFLFQNAMLRAVVARVTASDAAGLRELARAMNGGDLPEPELIRRYNRLITRLAEIADNPLLTVLNKLVFRALAPAVAREDPQRIHNTLEPGGGAVLVKHWEALIEAIIADDATSAVELLRTSRPGEQARLIQRAEDRRRLAQAGAAPLIASEILEAVDEGRGRKHSQLVALSVARNIAANGWRPGHHLGLEPALLAEYGVSRNIFREAARILEVHGVCSSKRGQRGGFIVGSPRPDYAVETAVSSLRFLGVEPRHVGEVRLTVQPNLAAAAAAADDRGRAMLDASLAGDPAGAANRFLSALGRVGANRVTGLVSAVLIGLEATEGPQPTASDAGMILARAAQAAIQDGDAALTRRIVMDLCRVDHPSL